MAKRRGKYKRPHDTPEGEKPDTVGRVLIKIQRSDHGHSPVRGHLVGNIIVAEGRVSELTQEIEEMLFGS